MSADVVDTYELRERVAAFLAEHDPATTDRLPLFNPARKAGAGARELAPISSRMEHE